MIRFPNQSQIWKITNFSTRWAMTIQCRICWTPPFKSRLHLKTVGILLLLGMSSRLQIENLINPTKEKWENGKMEWQLEPSHGHLAAQLLAQGSPGTDSQQLCLLNTTLSTLPHCLLNTTLHCMSRETPCVQVRVWALGACSYFYGFLLFLLFLLCLLVLPLPQFRKSSNLPDPLYSQQLHCLSLCCTECLTGKWQT